jgi:hypothetical protein
LSKFHAGFYCRYKMGAVRLLITLSIRV